MEDSSLADFLNEEPAHQKSGNDDASHQKSGNDDASHQKSGNDDGVQRGTIEPPTTEDSERTELAPAAVTSRSVPSETDCPDCGSTVTRLWHDDETFCCVTCKDW